MSSSSTGTISILKRLGLLDRLIDSALRNQREPRVSPRASRQKPEIVHTEDRAHTAAGQTPAVSDRVKPKDESKLQANPRSVTLAERQRVGKKDPKSGRQILQPTQSPIENEKLAAENAPKLETRLSSIAAHVPGARFERLRPQKNLERVDEKIQEGKPASTISDYLAAQVSVANPEAKDHLMDEIEREFPVINVDDQFLQGRKDKAGYPSTNLQVKLPNAATAEVQIVPTEVQEITDQTHHLYKEGRNARDAGEKQAAKTAFATAEKMNSEAVEEFLERNKLPPEKQPRAKHQPNHQPADRKISKGQEVTVLGRGDAKVLYVSPTMKIARVRFANGKTRTIGLSQIEP
jgi:hypothetical protein